MKNHSFTSHDNILSHDGIDYGLLLVSLRLLKPSP